MARGFYCIKPSFMILETKFFHSRINVSMIDKTQADATEITRLIDFSRAN